MKKQLSILDFKYGVIDSVEPQSIPRGASSGSLNWITEGTKIELRRGYALLGTTENGAGKITGLGVGKKPNGTDIVFRTRGRKIEYLDTTTDDWVEVGSDVIPAAASSDEISIEGYQNPTGPQIWLNSINSSLYKIMTANPGSHTDMYVLGTNYKGYMRIKNGRMYVWKRFGNPGNDTDLFASHLDIRADSDYTQISGEAYTGPTGTLAFKAAGARRICFQAVFTVTAGGEVFTDNGDGTLTGSLGTTGATLNYTTGVFAGMGTGAVTYRWADDSANATTPPTAAAAGIANFKYTVAARVATEGFILPQAGGGAFQNLMSLNGVEYCMHEKQTWAATISADDTTATNLIFRSKVGIPNWRAATESADGIYYIDDTNSEDIQFRILTLDTQSTEVLPKSISKSFKLRNILVGVNLSDYRFDQAAAIEFGEVVLFACRTPESLVNNRVFRYNKVNKATDILDYNVSVFAIYNNTLIAGDSFTDNVYTLFSGVDDNGFVISNEWNSSLDNLDWDGMKRLPELTIDGYVGEGQSGKISISVDNSDFVEVRSPSDVDNNKHAIESDGEYVDISDTISIGSVAIGDHEIGGGSDTISAYHYRRTFRISLDKFEKITFKIEATDYGYLSLSEFTFADVRLKNHKVPQRYRVGR
jgi:hypothetical protein